MLRRRHGRWPGLILGLAVILVILRWFERHQVYHPSRTMRADGSELGRPVETASIQTADGIALHGWFFPPDPDSARKTQVILYCHGNGGNISDRLEICQAILTTGVGVLLFDYRGYGRSAGRPREAGTYRDAEAAFDWLTSRGFTNVIGFGESLGGGVAAELALRRPLAGLALQSTFTSIPDVGAELFPWLPVRWLARIRYETLHKLPRIHVPVLILHSPEDRLVGYHHARRNFAAANKPKIFRDLEGGHNDPLANSDRFLEAVVELLNQVSP